MPRGTPLYLRLSEPLHGQLCSVAQDYRYTPNGWVVRLLANVLENEPLLRRSEVEALQESVRGLWAIGVNLNQIAKALNIRLKDGAGATGATNDHEAVALMREIRDSIDRHATSVAEIVARASVRRGEAKR